MDLKAPSRGAAALVSPAQYLYAIRNRKICIIKSAELESQRINKGFNEIQIVIILCVITQWTIVIGTLFINKNFYFIKLFISSFLMVASIFYIFNNRKKDINNLLDKVR